MYGCVSQSCRSAKKSQHKNKSTCWANQNSLLCAAGQKLWVSGFQDDSGDPGAPPGWHSTRLDVDVGSQGIPHGLFLWGLADGAACVPQGPWGPSSHPSPDCPSAGGGVLLEAFGPISPGLPQGCKIWDSSCIHSVTLGHSCSWTKQDILLAPSFSLGVLLT